MDNERLKAIEEVLAILLTESLSGIPSTREKDEVLKNYIESILKRSDLL